MSTLRNRNTPVWQHMPNHELLVRRHVTILQLSAGGLLASKAAGGSLCLSSPMLLFVPAPD